MKNGLFIILAASAMLCGQVEAHSLNQSKCTEVSIEMVDHLTVVDVMPFTGLTTHFGYEQTLATCSVQFHIDRLVPSYVVPQVIGVPDTKRHCAWVARVLKLC